MTTLIETIIEGGPLTQEQQQKALAGKGQLPEVKAILSAMEYAIGVAREESETAGCERTLRDEACGASRHLRALRGIVCQMLDSGPREG